MIGSLLPLLSITQEDLAKKLVEHFNDEALSTKRSHVSLVLTGRRGKKNPTLADQFRIAARDLVQDHISENSAPATEIIARLVKQMKGAAVQAGVDANQLDQVPIVDLIKAISPKNTQGPLMEPSGPIRSTAKNFIKTATIKAALEHISTTPDFNMLVSGPRYTGISTILTTVEQQIELNYPESLICTHSVKSISSAINEHSKLETSNLNNDFHNERVSRALSNLHKDLNESWKLPSPENVATATDSLVRALRRALTSPLIESRKRVLIIDNFDPTDKLLTLALADVATGLNEIRLRGSDISLVIGCRLDAEILAELGSEIRSRSQVLVERWHQVKTKPFLSEEYQFLAEQITDDCPLLGALPNPTIEKLKTLILEDSTILKGHPADLHTMAWWRRIGCKLNRPDALQPLPDLLEKKSSDTFFREGLSRFHHLQKLAPQIFPEYAENLSALRKQTPAEILDQCGPARRLFLLNSGVFVWCGDPAETPTAWSFEGRFLS